MSITNLELLKHLNNILKPEMVRDYCPNGLQVEGKKDIQKIITGVTACEALIDQAIEEGADAIFVHHGFFWKGEDPCLKGMKHRRIKKLLLHDINLYAYHLPLDIHPELGNNAQLAKLLGIELTDGLEMGNPQSVAMRGRFNEPVDIHALVEQMSSVLHRKPMLEAARDSTVRTVGLCTGGGQGYIDLAAEQGLDLFISGEVSEKTIHTAREMNIHFIAAGHHATERYGAKAMGEHLSSKFGLSVSFIDIDNPA